MNIIVIIAIVGVAVAVAVGVIVSLQPNIDRIIAEQDCDAVNSLGINDIARLTYDQAWEIGQLQGKCMLSR